MKKPRKIPVFKNEDEERKFWATHDITDYADFSDARPVVLRNLKPSTESISLRMPSPLLERMLANRLDIQYQSFIKTMLADGVAKRLHEKRKAKVES